MRDHPRPDHPDHPDHPGRDVAGALPALPLDADGGAPPAPSAPSPLAGLAGAARPGQHEPTSEVLLRRLDQGRLSVGWITEVLDWPRDALVDARLGPHAWVTFRATGALSGQAGRYRAHVDRGGRLLVDRGVRTWMGVGRSGDVVVRLAGDALQVAHVGLVARALDLLDGVADAAGEGVA